MKHQPTARIVRAAGIAATAVMLIGSGAALRPTWRHVPGLAFRVSASTRIYAGDTPRGQNDEVMRGRGVAAENRSRIEFLAYTPAPQGITTDDFLISVDSGKVFVQHTSPARYTPADDMLGGPAVVALSRIMGAGGGARFGRRRPVVAADLRAVQADAATAAAVVPRAVVAAAGGAGEADAPAAAVSAADCSASWNCWTSTSSSRSLAPATRSMVGRHSTIASRPTIGFCGAIRASRRMRSPRSGRPRCRQRFRIRSSRSLSPNSRRMDR